MVRPEIEAALAAAIEAESNVGIPWGWPKSEMASIAYRRWFSFARRHRQKHPTTEDRVLDLAKGLQSHFEPDILYTPLSEFLHLGRILAAIFDKFDS